MKQNGFKNKLKKPHFGKPEVLNRYLKVPYRENGEKRPTHPFFTEDFPEISYENPKIDSTFENEIPGGFDNVDAMSASIENEENSCYVPQEELELKPYIGLDWQDISVDSDSKYQYGPVISDEFTKIKCD